MGNKTIPDEVVTAMELAEAAGWKVSNRNKKVVITVPDGEHGINVSIGHTPNDESMKVFRSNCRKYNLVGQGPARTPSQTQALIAQAEAEGLAQADRLNAQRRAYEAQETAKRAAIKAAQDKAAAATQQGMIPHEETSMPSKSIHATDALPPFDAKLLGTKTSSNFLLPSGLYYCIECWENGVVSTFKGPQGMSTHRGIKHGLYPSTFAIVTQETSRVSLPTDVDTALDMLRVAIAEAIPEGGDPKLLAARDAEVLDLRQQLEALTKQADADRAAFDKRFEEAQRNADKKLVKAVADADRDAQAKREAEVQTLIENFLAILMEIKKAIESLSPVQAVGKIDTILNDNLNK